MLFWILAVALSALIGGWLFHALKTGGQGSVGNTDLGVYRTQLAELERDKLRGVIDDDEAGRARIEISRRILEIDSTGVAITGRHRSPLFPMVFIGVTLASAFALYVYLGAPGYPDLPMSERLARAETFHADRPSQADAEAETVLPDRPAPDPQFLDLVDRLRSAVASNPDDLTGLRLLARNEAALGNYADASVAQRHILTLTGDTATAADFAALADIYALATGGYISPEAEEALTAALERDPANGTARFYMGLMWAQTGRPDRAFELWRDLLEEGPEEAPWIPQIRAQIALLSRAAGVDYTPTAPNGPSADDIASAAEMTAQERQEMIRGMVEGLAERLASEGGSAEEWARLIFALAQLGDADRARAIWVEAQTVFAGRPDALATVNAAADQAGVAP